MRKLVTPIVLGLGILSVSCGTEKAAQKLVNTDPALVGDWKTGCNSNDVLELSHTTRELNFSALGDFDKTEKFYNTDDCSDSGFTYKVIGTYELVGKNEDTKQSKINYTIQNAKITVDSKTAVEILNATKMCDKTDWKIDEEVDITDAPCSDLIVNKGDVVFDLAKVDDNKLYLAKSSFLLASDDADSRPTEIDENTVFEKQ